MFFSMEDRFPVCHGNWRSRRRSFPNKGRNKKMRLHFASSLTLVDRNERALGRFDDFNKLRWKLTRYKPRRSVTPSYSNFGVIILRFERSRQNDGVSGGAPGGELAVVAKNSTKRRSQV